MLDQTHKPRWIRDLMRYLPLKSQFVLSGNVRDHCAYDVGPGMFSALPLIPYLAAELCAHDFKQVYSFNPTSGFRPVTAPGQRSEHDQRLVEVLCTTDSTQHTTGTQVVDSFSHGLNEISCYAGPPVALIADFASRLINRPDALSTAEHRAFTRALILSHEAKTRPRGEPPRPFFNNIIWIVDKEGDLPDWLVVNNPRVRHIPVPKPDHITRRLIAGGVLRTLSDYGQASEAQTEESLRTFVDSTEGMLVLDLLAIGHLARAEGLNFRRIAEAVRHYKLGVTEDPWQKIERTKIANAAPYIEKRVKGQKPAVTHMMDIVKRSVTGIGASRSSGRPRGVAFLAGPTGVGKTELAKTITSLLFGDESAYIRFDMSEFSAEHSDQRLMGAPPGYIGYDVGGELTNAIREKPFSVVLFDEIEKAHPRILDKFLQILDDGVLTSGRGDRVYFSESFIIFTSNLGIYSTTANGERVQTVSSEDPFEAVRARVRSEIERHFKLTLGRPEILNRIGENIIVFDFIREPIASEIFAHMLEGIIGDLTATRGVCVTLTADVLATIRKLCLADLSNGGRGIRNKLEVHLINPLARALFDANVQQGEQVSVDNVEIGEVTNFEISRREGAAL
jgi:energy-coupling factor transporter ATP-binding protein EcfA2